MKIKELRTGDIIETKDGRIGTVISSTRRSLNVKYNNSKWRYEFQLNTTIEDIGLKILLTHLQVLTVADKYGRLNETPHNTNK